MTFKEKPINKLYAFALAAVFALTLAGCGGGGGTAEEPPMTGPTDEERIAAAQTAAMTAAGVAAAALAAVEANKSADLDSYIRASIANDNAQAALEAANAATTPAAAEAAQADAEAASADVQKYAGMVTTAHNAIEAARMELMALNAAKEAAQAALDAAQAALDAIAGQGDADSASYDRAVAALAAATAANEAAQAAETSEAAEAAQADAEAARDNAMQYADMVTAAHTEATALADAKQAAMQAYTDAKAAVDAAKANRDSDPDSYDAAQRALGVAAEANRAAQAATTSEAAEAAQADVETASANAERYAGMVNQAKADADAEAARLAAAKKTRDAITKIANTKKAAITAEADTTTGQERPFDGTEAEVADDATSAPDAATKYKLSVSYKDGEANVDVRDGRNLLKGDPKFSTAERFGNGQMLTRDNSGTSREIIVLHTDGLDAGTPTAFTKVYPFNANDDPDRTGDNNFRSLTVITSGDPNHLAHIDLGVTTPDEGAESTKEFDQDDSTTPAVNEGMHRGRFDGAMGTYLCASTGCSVTVDDEGKATEMAGTWTFTPDAGATVDVADDNYLYYGFWLDTTTKDGKVTSYDAVQTFAGVGSGLTIPTRTLDAITGAAEYTGGAAGVYVHEVSKADGSNDYSTSGRFTADVYMHVHFDGTTNRVLNSMRGSISNFELEHGEEQNWNVTIRGIVGSDYALTNGSASGMQGDNGSLTGQFYGAAGEGDTDAPAAVVGEFNANFVNGMAAGAYGARLDD